MNCSVTGLVLAYLMMSYFGEIIIIANDRQEVSSSKLELIISSSKKYLVDTIVF